MAFQPGNSGKPVGAKNKIQSKFADAMNERGLDVAHELYERYMRALEDKNEDRALKVLLEMAQYIYPKLKSMEVKQASSFSEMTNEQKLQALKDAVKMLEIEVEKK